MIGQAQLGTVSVVTTQGRGFTPEELAERALDRIIYIGGQSHPVIEAQAQAFKENIRQVLIHYMHEAIVNDRITQAAIKG